MFKKCVKKNKEIEKEKKGGCFLFLFSSIINIARRKCVFKASESLLFSLFIINQYYTPNICYTTKNLFKTIDRLLFSLLS